MTFEIPREARQSAEENALAIWEDVLYDLKERTKSDEWQQMEIDDLEEILNEMEIKDVVCPGMSLDMELTTIERSDYADDLPVDLDFDRLRAQIEMAFTYVIHLEATALVRQAITELCDWREEHELEAYPLSREDPYRWFAPTQIREIDSETDVIEYRNVEGIDVDVWHFQQKFLEVFVPVALLREF